MSELYLFVLLLSKDNESAVRAAKRNTNGAIAKVDSVKKQLSESSSQLKTIERGKICGLSIPAAMHCMDKHHLKLC